MPISAGLIDHILKNGLEVKFTSKANDERAMFIINYGIENDDIGKFDLKVVISLLDPSDKGGYKFMEIRVMGFAGGDNSVIKNSAYLPQLQSYMLASNYQYKIGSWSLDVTDGDAYLSTAHVIEDDESMTTTQFIRMYTAVLRVANDAYPIVQGILKNGETGKPAEPEPSVDVEHEHLASGLVEQQREQLNRVLDQIYPHAENIASGEDSIDLHHLVLGSFIAGKQGQAVGGLRLHHHLDEHKGYLERFAEMKGINLFSVSAPSVDSSMEQSESLLSTIDEAVKEDEPLMFLFNSALTDMVKYVQRENTAYHEAGHAVISLVLRPEWRLTEISIIAKDNSNGRVAMDATSPIAHTPTTLEYVMEDICVRLAGQLSQVRKFGSNEADAGATHDYYVATTQAYRAVAIFGLDDEYGPVHLPAIQKVIDDAMSGTVASGYLFDQAQIRTQAILKQAKQHTDDLIEDNWEAIERVAQLLVIQDTVSEDEIQSILKSLNTH